MLSNEYGNPSWRKHSDSSRNVHILSLSVILSTMNELTFCELRGKEIVNVVDGRRLGRLSDLAMTCSGKVLGIMAPGDRSAIRSFSGKETVFIPWQNITKIGDDVILVNLMVAPFLSKVQ